MISLPLHKLHICLHMLFMLLLLGITMQAAPAFAQGWTVDVRPPTFSNLDDEEPVDDPGEQVVPYTYFASQYRTAEGNNKALEMACSGQSAGGTAGFTTLVVGCITGIMNNAIEAFYAEFRPYLTAYILALITLAITIFGARILVGAVERPGPEAFTLLLKIGAVMLFCDMMGGFLPQIFPIMETMAGIAMSYISENAQGGELSMIPDCGTAVDSGRIWEQVDCVMERLFFGNPAEAFAKVAPIWLLVSALLFTGVFGFMAFLIMCAVLLMIFLLLIRCVYVFLAAYAVLALLVIISPLIIPLALFKNTVNYFNKWWRQFLSMLIQPVLLFAWMAFIFALLDSMFYQNNEYSLASILGEGWFEAEVQTGEELSDGQEISRRLEAYTREYGYEPDTQEYKDYQRQLRETLYYARVGNVLLVEERLINIQINAFSDLTENISDMGAFGEIAEVVNLDEIADEMDNWINEQIEATLIPFTVVKVQPIAREVTAFIVDIVKFFVVLLVLLPLLLKFSRDIPMVIHQLSSAIRLMPGAQLPGERQVHGVTGAAKGATVGAAKGAVKGFVTGGVAGAARGAVKEGAKGAAQGYRKGVTGRSGKVGGSSDVMAKGSEGTQRKLLHGEAGGSKAIGMAKSLAGEKAFQKGAGAAMGKMKGGGAGGTGGGGRGGIGRK